MHHHLSSPLRQVAAAAACVAASFASVSAQAAPLPLVNGSFENPGCAGNCPLGTGSTFITGWTTFNTGVEYFNAPAFGGTAPQGVMVVDLANYTSSAGGIQQSFDTQIGQIYMLSFWAGNTLQSGRTGTGDVHVQAGNMNFTFATPVATSAAYVWQQFDIPFMATATTTTLKLSNTQNANFHFAFIDAVSVSAVPEPGAVAMWLAGLAGLAAKGAVARRPSAGCGTERHSNHTEVNLLA